MITWFLWMYGELELIAALKFVYAEEDESKENDEVGTLLGSI